MELVITLITLKVGNIIILSTNIAIGFNLRKLVPPKCINSTFLCTYSIRLIMARHLTFYENVTFKERPEKPDVQNYIKPALITIKRYILD